MKRLYINDKRVIIDEENMYFPFSYKINNLEDVNIIGIPQSKEIEIKRFPENDEIFGYLGELTRNNFNFTDNNYISVSFNQTKKGEYKLYNDNEIVSEGQIQVVNVTDDYYTIILYDKIIELIEKFDGDEETGKGYLNDMDLYFRDNTLFKSVVDKDKITDLTNNSTDLIPTFNISSAPDNKGNEIICLYGDEEYYYNQHLIGKEHYFNDVVNKVNLPSEMTALQARTFKSYEPDFCVPISNVIKSINKYKIDDSINFNLLKDTTDTNTNSIISGGVSYSLLTDEILKSDVEFLTGHTYTISLIGNNFPNGQYNIGIKVNNGGVITDYIGSLVNNGERSYITYTIPNNFINFIIYVSNNNIIVPTNTTINYKELKVEEGEVITKWIPNIYDENNFNYIKYDKDVEKIFNNVYMNCGMLKQTTDKQEESGTIFTEEIQRYTGFEWKKKYDDKVGISYDMNDFYKKNYYIAQIYRSGFCVFYIDNNNNFLRKNGKYDLNLNYEMDFFNTGISDYVTKYNGKEIEVDDLDDGMFVGEFTLTFNIMKVNTQEIPQIDTLYKYYLPIKKQIKLYNNKNFFYNNSNHTIKIIDDINLSFNSYFDFLSFDESFCIEVNFLEIYNNTELFNNSNKDEINNLFYFKVKQSEYTYSKNVTNITSHDLITGKNIFPKISIKDFLINTTKFFNLDLINNKGVLEFKTKTYNLTSDILLIDKINSIDTKIYDFNKLILTTEISDNDYLKEYEEKYKQKYGQKNINTGFNIRNNVKENKYDVGVPSFMIDINSTAYGEFLNYNNNGYSYYNYGEANFKDKIVFCYISTIEDTIYVSNDHYLEYGMTTNRLGANQPIYIHVDINGRNYGEKFIKTNMYYRYKYSEGGEKIDEPYWEIISDDYASYLKYDYDFTNKLTKYKTMSPYLFDEDGNVYKSLEMNKSFYNFSNLTDENYPESSTLYSTYHKKIIEDKYSVNTHIIDADIYFDSVPNIYNIYNIKGSNYIISELPEYDPTTDGEIFQGVKLLKVNNINNYIDTNEVLNVEISHTNTTGIGVSNGTITINIISGNGYYYYYIYEIVNGVSILIGQFDASSTTHTFTGLTGNKNYKIKVDDGEDKIYKDIFINNPGPLTLNYTIIQLSGIESNDGVVSVNIIDGTPIFTLTLTKTGETPIEKNNNTIGTVNFNNLSYGDYILVVNDLYSSKTYNLKIEQPVLLQYTITQELIFDGNISTYQSIIFGCENNIYNKFNTDLQYKKIDNISANSSYTLSYNATTNKTTLTQSNYKEDILYFDKIYNYLLSDNSLVYKKNQITTKYDLFQTNNLSINTLGDNESVTIYNNQYGYSDVIITTGTKKIAMMTATGIKDELIEYSDGQWMVRCHLLMNVVEGLNEFDFDTNVTIGDLWVTSRRTPTSEWETYQYTPENFVHIIAGGYLIVQFDIKLPFMINDDFGTSLTNSISTIKLIPIDDGNVHLTYLYKIELDKNTPNHPIIYVMDLQETKFELDGNNSIQTHENFEGDNGISETKMKLLNYKVTFDYNV